MALGIVGIGLGAVRGQIAIGVIGEPSQRRGVIAGAVVIKPGVLVEPAAGILIGGRVGAQAVGEAVGRIAVLLGHLAEVVDLGNDRALHIGKLIEDIAERIIGGHRLIKPCTIDEALGPGDGGADGASIFSELAIAIGGIIGDGGAIDGLGLAVAEGIVSIGDGGAGLD